MNPRTGHIFGVVLVSSVAGASLALALKAVGVGVARRSSGKDVELAEPLKWVERQISLDLGTYLVEAPFEVSRRIRVHNPFGERLRLNCASRLPCCISIKAPPFIDASKEAEVEVRVLLRPGTKLDLPVEVTGWGRRGVRWSIEVKVRGYPKAVVRAPETLVSVAGAPAESMLTCERYGLSREAVEVRLQAEVAKPCAVTAVKAHEPVSGADGVWHRRWEVGLRFTGQDAGRIGASLIKLLWSDGVSVTRSVGWRIVPMVSPTPAVVLLTGRNRSKTVVVASHDRRPFELRLVRESAGAPFRLAIEPGKRRLHLVRIEAPPEVSGRFQVKLATSHPTQPLVTIPVVVQSR